MPPDSWTTYKLGGVTENHDFKRIPVKKPDRQHGSYPYYGASGIVDYVDDFIFEGEYLLVAEDGENLRSRKMPIAFIVTGRFWVNNHAHIVRGNDLANTRYLAYALERCDVGGYITGSTMPKLTQQNLNQIELTLPSKQEQDAIVEVVRSLDDKIELNRRMNRTLEQMAAAIFKAWFVDFEPVKAKAAGATNFPAMPQSVFDALPTEFTDSPLGPIPKEWNIGVLEDLLVLQRGFDLPKTQRTPGPYPVIAASGPNGTHHEYKVSGPGVTTGRSGVLGKVYIVLDDFWPLNTSLWVKEYRRSNPYHAYFVLQLLNFATFNSGSAVPTLNRNHVHNLPMAVPPEALTQCFMEVAERLFRKKRSNDLESDTLAVIRDALLPKLLSGEIRVGKVAQVVEDVA